MIFIRPLSQVVGSARVGGVNLGCPMYQTRFVIVFVITAILVLTGSQCVVVVSSGSGTSDKDKDQDDGVVIIASEGRFIDAPVQGLRYVSGSIAGMTGANGEFLFEPGTPVRFFLGDIPLGKPVDGKIIVTPLDLVDGGTINTSAAINIARLLQSLDAVPGDDRITIPVETSRTAVYANKTIAASLEFLDFADETTFVNTASQLIAVLTASYPFTAVLIDSETAQQHLVESLARYGIKGKSVAHPVP